jgi:hypothetical protein
VGRALGCSVVLYILLIAATAAIAFGLLR